MPEVTANFPRRLATTTAALFAAFCALAVFDPGIVAQAAAASVEDHIAAVENGLIASPQITGAPGRTYTLAAQMGLGIFLRGSGSDALFFHAGADEGFQAQLLGYDAGYGVVVMVDSDNGLRLAAEIIQSLSGNMVGRLSVMSRKYL
jgi:hypothetical protein